MCPAPTFAERMAAKAAKAAEAGAPKELPVFEERKAIDARPPSMSELMDQAEYDRLCDTVARIGPWHRPDYRAAARWLAERNLDIGIELHDVPMTRIQKLMFTFQRHNKGEVLPSLVADTGNGPDTAWVNRTFNDAMYDMLEAGMVTKETTVPRGTK